MWRTVLIEDQALLRNVLAKAVAMHPEFDLIADCADGAEGRAVCLRERPDLVVTDVDMPEVNGFQLAEELLNSLPKVRILALTNLKDAFTISRLREIGVHGYVEKDQPLEILEESMRRVAEGGYYFTELARDVTSNLVRDPEAFCKILSRREQDIVRLVAEGLSNRDIAERLHLHPRSVETHRYRAMKKVGVKNVVELIRYAEDHGIWRREDPRQG